MRTPLNFLSNFALFFISLTLLDALSKTWFVPDFDFVHLVPVSTSITFSIMFLNFCNLNMFLIRGHKTCSCVLNPADLDMNKMILSNWDIFLQRF